MTAIIKLLFDLCFYYTLSGYFLHLATSGYPVIWGIPLLIASNTVYLILKKFFPDSESHNSESHNSESHHVESRIFRNVESRIFRHAQRLYERTRIRPLAIACCALPAIMGLANPTLWQLLQFLPAWAYYCFIIWSERAAVTYREFEDHFAFTGKLHFLLLIGILVLVRIPGALTGAIPYFALYILSGVCLMRILREEGKLSAGRSASAVLALLFGAIVITVFRAPQLFVTVVEFLYLNVIVWVITGLAVIIAALFYAIYFLFAAIVSLFNANSMPLKSDLGVIAQNILGEELVSTQSASLVWLKAVLLALLAIAIALTVFLIFRKLLGKKSSVRIDSAYIIEQERLDKKAHIKTGGRFRPKEIRLAVRWYYRKYLKEGISRGAKLSPSDTSKSVLLQYEHYFAGNSSDRLREVYIKARYAQQYPVQSDDVAEAQELWKSLKG